MAGIIGIIALLIVLTLSLIITRVTSVALTMTGMSEDAARFQARSAFTGTGFTTSEAEQVVNHPVRRRILMILMILRSAGLVTIIISLILSFMGPEEDIAKVIRLGWVVLGVGILWLLASSKKLDRYVIAPVIEWALDRWTNLDVRDYAGLLRLSGQYSIMEVPVEEGDWVGGKTLNNCNLHEEGVTVLGITRADGRYMGVPTGRTKVYPGDTLLLYGRSKDLQELGKRKANVSGDQAHAQAVSEQEKTQQQEQEEDREYTKHKNGDQYS